MAFENGEYVPEVTSPEHLLIEAEEHDDDVVLARSIRATTRPDREPEWVTSVLGPRRGWKSFETRRIA